jgi:hypothetical protein
MTLKTIYMYSTVYLSTEKALHVSLTERLPLTNIASQGSGYQTGLPEYPGIWRKWQVRLKAKLILPKC